ncbi:MAG: hypothetical protein KAI47_00565 [Deltaproteobacteria bacterium]|nr:hypothetical protein [Deltaproteobacteria bacterium]
MRKQIIIWLGAAFLLSACCDRATSGNQDLGPLPVDHGNVWLDGDPGFCRSAGDCAGDEYCQAVGCNQTGRCERRPKGCDMMYAPVCGCDGLTYGNACEAHAAGIDDDYAGECKGNNQPACEALLGNYAAALTQAKQCSPMLGVEQCTALVTVSLPCGCETFINGLDPDDRKAIDKLALEWTVLNCVQYPWPCTGVPCSVTPKGYCGSNGRCQDAP